MEDDDGLNDSLRLQFLALREQQEKRLQRRFNKKKENEPERLIASGPQETLQTQDDLNLSEIDTVHTDDFKEKWALSKLNYPRYPEP